MISFLKEKVELKSTDEILKLHLIIKCFQKGYNLSNADIECLIEMNKVGYNEDFYKSCVDRGIYKSGQTVRNAITKMTHLGIVVYKKRGQRFISKEFLPSFNSDKVLVQYLVANL